MANLYETNSRHTLKNVQFEKNKKYMTQDVENKYLRLTSSDKTSSNKKYVHLANGHFRLENCQTLHHFNKLDAIFHFPLWKQSQNLKSDLYD